MQGNNITSRIKLFGRSDSFYAILLNHFFRAESVESIDVHAETLGDTRHIASYIAISVNTQLLAHQFRTGGAVVHVADSHYHKSESQFGYGIGVLSRSVHHTYVVGSGGSQVHIVITGTGTYHDFQFFGGVQHLGIDDVATYNNSIGVFHSFQQFRLVTIFFQQSKFITCCFNFFADTVYCNLCKRLVCCD